MYKLEIENEKNYFLNKNKIIIIHQNKRPYILQILTKNKLKNLFNYKYIFLIILIIYFCIIFNSENFQFKNKKNEGEFIYKSKTLKYLKLELVNKFNFYINICKTGKLTNKKRYPLLKRPKISVIMPIFNGGKYLNYSLCSIQNQKMKEIEIILIDDLSSDNSIIF